MRKFIRSFSLAACLLVPAAAVLPAAAFANGDVSGSSGVSVAVAGQWELKDGNWYYLDQTGAYSTGWDWIGSKWYFFNQDGIMQTGWLLYNNNWYYLSADGDMKTGWVQDQNNWYYLNPTGEMVTGWKLVNSKWYYLDPNGAMKTSWQLINNKWYYLKPTGEMVTGWNYLTYGLGDDWYYFNQTGEMLTGWVKDAAKSYLLLPDGRWAHNTVYNGYFYQNHTVKYPGNSNIVSNVNKLKTQLRPGQTQEQIQAILGTAYAPNETGFLWEYSLAVTGQTAFKNITTQYTHLSPIDLGTGKVGIRILILWDSNKNASSINIAYFNTDHRLHHYQNSTAGEFDVVWTSGEID